MERVKLLLADSDARFTDMVVLFLKNFPDIDLIGCAANGHDAMNSIRNDHPDAVLFDLVLPGLDGISLLRSVQELRSPPAMICCTRFYSDVAMDAMRNFGAAYLMYKPIELQILHPVIVACANLHNKMRSSLRELDEASISVDDSRARIRNYIVSLGIPTKLIGCTYLTEAVLLARTDSTLVRNLSKGLYLEIARSMNSTPTRIERCIRNAIAMGFQTGGLDTHLPSCPSNKEFINYVLRTIDF